MVKYHVLRRNIEKAEIREMVNYAELKNVDFEHLSINYLDIEEK